MHAGVRLAFILRGRDTDSDYDCRSDFDHRRDGHHTIHWQLGLGVVLLVVVLVAPNGLASLLKLRRAR